MQTLKKHGVTIPGDIAIAGFNNDAISKITEPRLTTIYNPGTAVGEIAARNLINHLKGEYNIQQPKTNFVKQASQKSHSWLLRTSRGCRRDHG